MNHPQSAGTSNTNTLQNLIAMIGGGPDRSALHAGATPYPPVPNDEDVGDEIPPQSDAGDDSLERDQATPAPTPPSPGTKPS